MLHRAISGTLWLKVLSVALVLAGLSHRNSALVVTTIVAVLVVRHLVDGHREQYWEPAREQSARHWEDVVWNNSRWINPETPDEGVTRLVGPFRQPPPPLRAPHELEER